MQCPAHLLHYRVAKTRSARINANRSPRRRHSAGAALLPLRRGAEDSPLIFFGVFICNGGVSMDRLHIIQVLNAVEQSEGL